MDENPAELNYQGFQTRWKSYLIDNILLGLFLGIASFINITFYQSFYIYLITALIAVGYKPTLESMYGATLGKMLINIKVVDYDGNRINIAQAILRNIFKITQLLLVVFFQYAAFNDPVLLSTKNYFDYQLLFQESYTGVSYISNAMFVITMAELISMNIDLKHRSLHDRIAKTVVVSC